jgi:hypothetical protein
LIKSGYTATLIFVLLLFNTSILLSRAVTGPLVVSSTWPECTSLTTWTRDVLRLDGVERESETRQGISVYTWLRLFNRVSIGGMQHAWEGPPGEETYLLDPHKHLFVYGWGICDTHSRIFESLWREWTGDPASAYRVVYKMGSTGGYHTVSRVRLDGNYGAFDARFGFYLLDRDSPDARVLDWQEVGDDRNIERNEKYSNRCRPFFEYAVTERPYTVGLEEVYFENAAQWTAAGEKASQPYAAPRHSMGTAFHDMNWRIPRGTKIERFWNNDFKKYYVTLSMKPYEQQSPILPSGRFYRVTETMFEENWPKFDPNYKRAEPYLETVPVDEGYPEEMAGGKTIGQAWGTFSYCADLAGDGYLDALASESGMVHAESGPYLMPAQVRTPGEAVFDFYCPFILVDGEFTGELAAGSWSDRVSLEIRTLYPKTEHRDQPDHWSEWRKLAAGKGVFKVSLGREAYSVKEVSVHGKYRFQLRVKSYAAKNTSKVGLKALAFNCHFENGIMSIPRIVAGDNTITFKVGDSQAVKAPLKVTYNYQAASGPSSHTKIIKPADFSGNQARYLLSSPGLVRCNSLLIEY